MESSGNFDQHDQDRERSKSPGSGPDRLGPGRTLPPDSEMLLKKAFESDANMGIELMFRWYYRPLCSHAVRFVSSKEIAEDIVSDVFYKFHRDKVFASVETSFRAYLFTAVRYSAFDYVRVEMKRNTSLEFAEYVTMQPEQQPDHITQFEDLYNDVENAINTLPQKRRKIYLMHRYDGKKYGEIASELGLSLRTVESQMYGAMQEVRRIIKAKWFFLLLVFLQ